MEKRIDDIRDQLGKSLLVERMGIGEMEEALIQIADEEMLQLERPIRADLIASCHTMVYQLHGSELPCVNAMQESLTRVERSIDRRSKMRTSIMFGLKVVAVLVLVSIAAFSFDHFANRTLLHGDTIEEGEQYRIEGHQPVDTIINDGNAAQEGQSVHLSTKDMTEITGKLGYVPMHPTWTPEGWELSNYFVVSSEEISIFSATYQHPEYQEVLSYNNKRYAHPENAAANFEQDEEGVYEIWGKHKVYLTTNMGYHMVIWVDGAEVCSVGGPLSFEQLRLVFDSLGF